MKNLFLLLCSIILVSCNNGNTNNAGENENTRVVNERQEKGSAAQNSFGGSIEEAHNKNAYINNKAVSYTINLNLEGKDEITSFKVTALTGDNRKRIDKQDGTKIIYDGEQVYLCPGIAKETGAQFTVFSWHFFFSLPHNLSAGRDQLELLGVESNNGTSFKKGSLSIDEKEVRAGQESYILLQEQETGLLHAVGDINRLSHEKQVSDNEKYALVYRNYIVKNSVPVATRWSFHTWDSNNGIGNQIGEATITNITFFDAKEDLFEEPEDSRIVAKN